MLVKILVTIAIFFLSLLQSRLANRLYYAMQDHRPIRAGLYDWCGNLLGWAVAIFIWGNLMINLSWEAVSSWSAFINVFGWTIIYALADSTGDPIVTWWDTKQHREVHNELT